MKRSEWFDPGCEICQLHLQEAYRYRNHWQARKCALERLKEHIRHRHPWIL